MKIVTEVAPVLRHVFPQSCFMLLLALCGLSVWTADDSQAATYGFTILDASLDKSGATFTSPASINDSGQVTGYYNDGSGRHGFVYGNGTFTILDAPGAYETSPASINDSGQVTGYYRDAFGRHGFVYGSGLYTTLDMPAADKTSPASINDSGQVTGYYDDDSGRHGFVYGNGTFATIEAPGAYEISPASINDSGQVTGYYRDGSGYHGFVYGNSTFTTIDVLGAIDTFAASINDSGQVAGYYRDRSGYHGFVYGNGTFTILDAPGAISTAALSVSDSGQVTGQCYDGSIFHGFVYGNGAFTILDPPGANSTFPTSINGSGQVTGHYHDGSGTLGSNPGFIATPLADPTPLIDHYYRSILARAPDPGGLAFWQSEIARLRGLGVDAQEAFRVMAGWFFDSPEYLSRGIDDSQYVTDLYRTFFQRDPDGDGLSFWIEQLPQGMPRSVALFSFLFSAEFGSYMRGLLGDTASRAEVYTVVDFYRGFLNRLPDAGGFGYWVNRFRVAQCQGAAAVDAAVDSISTQFLGSAEYAGRNRSNSDYVADLYYAFLRRGGELTGFNFWVSQLNNGLKTREQLRQEFLKSPEFQSCVSQIISQGCL